jgi:hypothetical protein
VSARILPFPRRAPQCEHCGCLALPISATELRHYYLCTLPRQKAEARARRLERARSEWHATATKTPRYRGIGPRRPDGPAPLPARVPSAWHREQLELLQAALCYPEMRERLTALTRLPLDALERVATGRSTMGATPWRRVMAELDR